MAAEGTGMQAGSDITAASRNTSDSQNFLDDF